MISTDMQKLIDWKSVMSLPRCAGGHDEQMKELFLGAKVLAHYNEGSYDGTVATAVQLADGRFAWYQDSYGSCSGCDSWEDCSDDTARKLLIDLANNARVFDSLAEMLADMKGTDPNKGQWWGDAAKALVAELEKP